MLNCYDVAGKPYASLDTYIPCNATAAAGGGHSSCCAPGDNCLTNGLCQGQRDSSRSSNLFWRNGCTDPTWNDPACPKFCKGFGTNPNTSHGVFFCLKDNKWCCPTGGFDSSQALNTTCCSRTDLSFTASDPLVFTVAGVNIGSTMLNLGPSASSTAALSSPLAATASATPTQSISVAPVSSTASTTDSKIGFYVGLPLGILLAIALGVIIWLISKNRKQKRQAPEDDAVRMTHVYAMEKELPRYELETSPTELSDNKTMAPELPTTGQWNNHEY